MPEFSFISGNLDETREQLAIWLGNKQEGNIIHLDEFTGKGSVFIAGLETGLFIRAWNYTLNEETIFHLKPVTDNKPVFFTVNYILTPVTYQIETPTQKATATYHVSNLNNILLSTSRSEFTYIVRSQKPAKSVEICFTGKWLEDQFPDDGIKVERLLSLTSGKSWLPQAFSLKDYSIAGELIEKIFSTNTDKIFLKSRILFLLDDLLNKFFDSDKVQSAPLTSNVADITEVEKYIISSLRGKLPELGELARKFSMGQSTLKRQFRALYGKNIYEYYLQKKMELAKQILLEEKKTISEVAHILGYEKLSSFSTIFKKHFGKTPGSISENDR